MALVCSVCGAQAEASSPCASSAPVLGPTSARAAGPPSDTVTVASLNIAGQAQIGDVLFEWARDRVIDILLLQEVGASSLDGEAFVAALGERLGFHVVYAPVQVIGDIRTQGLAILSRYPLHDARSVPLAYHRLRFKTRCRIALAATVETTDGPLGLVNVHLDTRINSQARVAQLAPVLDAFEGIDRPQIIGGDFNTMNIGWFRTMWPFPYVQRQVTAVRGALTSAGFDTPFVDTPPTFRFFGLPFRLDWLFLKNAQTGESGVDRVRFSDHRGVWARVTRPALTGHRCGTIITR
jgi:endonuclease/exonuclease/phosphatase family metal-dependent hydrolase